jgi:hypothetical protein
MSKIAQGGGGKARPPRSPRVYIRVVTHQEEVDRIGERLLPRPPGPLVAVPARRPPAAAAEGESAGEAGAEEGDRER